MKRRLLIVAVFLLAGAVVNVAVAWGCSFLGKHPSFTETGRPLSRSDSARSILDRYAPSEWFVIDQARRAVTFGRASSIVVWQKEDRSLDLLVLVDSGWPALSLRMVRRTPESQAGGFEWLTALEMPPAVTRWHGMGYLPLGPIWPGFVVNTLVYAAALWLLACGLLVVRRFVRVRRGLCPKCAYPMGQSDACSECGKPRPGRTAVTT